MGGNKNNNKGNKQQKKKKAAAQQEHQTRQQEKQEERKTKRQRKHEKNKFNKAKHESDMSKFRVQLAQYGLKVVEMGGDGNCLFRTIADQLEGNEKLHRKYRQDAIEYIENNKEQYAPFIEDDETIDQYLSDLSKDGTWGGQLELQVLCLVYRFNYIVHQVDNPIMAFSSFDWGTVPTLHLSYHMGEHYNSVRLLEDPCDGPPLPIGHELKLKQVAVVENEILMDQKESSSDINTASSSDMPSKETITQYAMTLSGYTDYDLMSEAIDECFGSDEMLTYETIEQAISPLTTIYEEFELKKLQSDFDTKVQLNGESPQENGGKRDIDKLTKEEKLKELQKDDKILTKDGNIVDMPAQNKKCPCGSKKNYKKCQCSNEDLHRKTEYIEKLTKKIETSKPKQQNILLL